MLELVIFMKGLKEGLYFIIQQIFLFQSLLEKQEELLHHLFNPPLALFRLLHSLGYLGLHLEVMEALKFLCHENRHDM